MNFDERAAKQHPYYLLALPQSAQLHFEGSFMKQLTPVFVISDLSHICQKFLHL